MTPPRSSANQDLSDVEAPTRRATVPPMGWVTAARGAVLVASAEVADTAGVAPVTVGPTTTAQDRAASDVANPHANPNPNVNVNVNGDSSGGATDGARAWREHRVLANVVRVTVLLAPAVFASGATLLLGHLLPPPPTLFLAVVRLLLILCVSGTTMIAVRLASRRLLPLSTLLRLSLAFPDETPKRLRLALRAPSAKHLEDRLNDVSRAGLKGEPTDVAAEIVTLVAAISAHHKHTRGHSERVRAYTELLAVELGLTESERVRLRWAALLHDLGKITVPTEILDKPGKPTREEWAILAAHPAASARLAEPLKEWMGEWWYGIGQHHEKWDGSGYPDKLEGEAISLSGRIVALADSFETMTAARSYKKPMSIADARRELVRCAGGHFDPTVVRAFLNIGNRRLRVAAGLAPWIPLPIVNALLPLGQFATTASQTSVAVFAGAAAVTAITPYAVTPDPLFSMPDLTLVGRELVPDQADRSAIVLDPSTSTTFVTVADGNAGTVDGNGDPVSSTSPVGRAASPAARSAGASPTSATTASPATTATTTTATTDLPTGAPATTPATTVATAATTVPVAARPTNAPPATRATTSATTAPTKPTKPTPTTPTTAKAPSPTTRPAATPTTAAPRTASALVVANDQFSVATEVIVIVQPLANDSGMDPATLEITHKAPNVLSWVNPDHTVSILARNASKGSSPSVEYRLCTSGWGTCRKATIAITVRG